MALCPKNGFVFCINIAFQTVLTLAVVAVWMGQIPHVGFLVCEEYDDGFGSFSRFDVSVLFALNRVAVCPDAFLQRFAFLVQLF